MLTRRDFKELASIVKEQHEKHGYDAARWLFKELVTLCKKNNPNFSIQNFEDACFS